MSILDGLIDKVKAGLGNVTKNHLGRWVGWNGAALTHKYLIKAMGEDAENVIAMVNRYSTAAEFAGGMLETVLTPEMQRFLGPVRSRVVTALLKNMGEHVLPEYFEEMKRIAKESDSPARTKKIQGIWGTVLAQVDDQVTAPSDELLGRVIFGGKHYIHHKDCGCYKDMLAALKAPNVQRHVASGRAGGKLEVTDLEGASTSFIHDEIDFEGALNQPLSEFCSQCFSLIQHSMFATGSTGSSSGIWDKVGWAGRPFASKNLGIFQKALVEAHAKAEKRAEEVLANQADPSKSVNTVLTAQEKWLSDIDLVMEDSTEQIRKCKDEGAMMLLVNAPNDNLYEIYQAIIQCGGHASADYKGAQQIVNLHRWAKQNAPRVALFAKGLPQWVVAHLDNKTTQKWLNRFMQGIVLFIVGAAITFASAMTWDFFIGHALRLLGISVGLALMAFLPIYLFLAHSALNIADKMIVRHIAAGIAVVLTKFEIEVPEKAEDWKLFDTGDTLAKTATGLGVLICMTWSFMAGIVEGDALTHGHKLFLGLRLVLFGAFGFAIAGSLNNITTKNASETTMLDSNKRKRVVAWFIDFLTKKPMVVLAVLTPLAIGGLLVSTMFLNYLPGGDGFEKNAIHARYNDDFHWSWDIPDKLIMPGGRVSYSPKQLFGEYDENINVCSSGLVHLDGGATPGRYGDWNVWRSFWSLIRADYEPEPRVLSPSDLTVASATLTTKVRMPDGDLVIMDDLFGGSGCWHMGHGAVVIDTKKPNCSIHNIDGANWQPTIGPSGQVSWVWWKNPPQKPKVLPGN